MHIRHISGKKGKLADEEYLKEIFIQMQYVYAAAFFPFSKRSPRKAGMLVPKTA